MILSRRVELASSLLISFPRRQPSGSRPPIARGSTEGFSPPPGRPVRAPRKPWLCVRCLHDGHHGCPGRCRHGRSCPRRTPPQGGCSRKLRRPRNLHRRTGAGWSWLCRWCPRRISARCRTDGRRSCGGRGVGGLPCARHACGSRVTEGVGLGAPPARGNRERTFLLNERLLGAASCARKPHCSQVGRAHWSEGGFSRRNRTLLPPLLPRSRTRRPE